MTTDDREIVSAVQLALADKVGAERFELWFAGHTRLTITGDTLTVSVPSNFYQDWLRKHFRGAIEQVCSDVLGRATNVAFQIDASLAPQSADGKKGSNGKKAAKIAKTPSTGQKLIPGFGEDAESDDASSNTDPSATGDTTSGHSSSDGVAPSSVATAAPVLAPEPSSERRRFASFDTFILGDGNRVAHTAARQVLEQRGLASPLVLHGPTGVGKSHLLQAIWCAARRCSSLQTVYLTAEQFTTQFIDALNGRGLPTFRRKYRGLGLLIIDDLHFFANKRATQSELVHTIDSLLADGKQMVFACDRAPTLLTELGPELIARLQGGVSCALELPDYPTRLGIVRRVASAMGISATDDVWEFVAGRLASHARSLIGAVKRVQIRSTAEQRSIDLVMAQEVLAEMVEATPRCVRIADVEEAVCRGFGLDPKSLHEEAGGKRLQAARTLAMWLARKHTRSALSEISRFFGLRSHSTVLSAQKRVEQWMKAGESLEFGSRYVTAQDAIRQIERLLAG